jgi:hypothetical protein
MGAISETGYGDRTGNGLRRALPVQVLRPTME